MGTTNTLDLNNRISALEKGEVLTASDIMMSDGVTSVDDAVDELKSGLTSKVVAIVTLPATTTGYSSVQIDNVLPQGAIVVGYAIYNVSTYSDGVCITAYFNGTTCRVTMVGGVENVPQITCELNIGIIY